jgi:4-hydroxy-3-methylbut-2-enyl diphosphate reductase
LLIGHAGHPEVAGTMGQLPPGAITLIETVEDARAFTPKGAGELAYTTQTTLSVDDTAEIVALLRARFPAIVGPPKEDICYATTNRQAAVKAIAPRVDALIVVGAQNSSNSQRLVEVGKKMGCRRTFLVERAADLDWLALKEVRTVGITAGASAPEVLVDEIVAAFRSRYKVSLETVATAEERIAFNVPRELRSAPS